MNAGSPKVAMQERPAGTPRFARSVRYRRPHVESAYALVDNKGARRWQDGSGSSRANSQDGQAVPSHKSLLIQGSVPQLRLFAAGSFRSGTRWRIMT